jgi:O-antigen/teichoic acid export membrane protein
MASMTMDHVPMKDGIEAYEGRREVRLHARNAVSAYVARGLLAVSVLVLTPYLYRELGQAGFGTWSIVFTFASVFTLFEFGFSRGASKLVAELLAEDRRPDLRRLTGVAVTGMGLLGLASAALCVLLAIFASGLAPAGFEDDFRASLLILAIARLVCSPLMAYNAVLQGYQRYDLSNIVNSVGTIVFTVLAIVVVAAGWGIVGVTGALSASFVVMGLGAAVCLHRVDGDLPLRPQVGDGETRQSLTHFGSYVLLADSMTFVGQRMDTLVIAAVRNAAAAGPYAAMIKLQSGVQSLTLPVIFQLMPMVSDLWARGRSAEVARRLAMAVRMALQATIPLAAALALFSTDIVDLWLGSDAPPVTEHILVILMITQIVLLTVAPAEQVLVAIGRVRAIAIFTLVGGLANLALSIVLVWAYGAIGAAVGTLATSGVLAPFVLLVTARAVGEPSLRMLRLSVLPAVVSSLPALGAMAAVRVLLPTGTERLAVGIALGIGLAAAVGALQLGPKRLLTAGRTAMARG